MANSRILVVDDDCSSLTALKAALRLRMNEVAVETVDSGAGALQRLATVEFDAVITDIKMPGMDGLTLLGEIRRMDPDLPTLLITGHGQHDLAVQALRGGAFDFIQKPIDRDYLVAALTRAIQVRQLHRQVCFQQQALQRHTAELEQAVKERTHKLQEANEAKDRFLAMLAHELRNPLACIRYAVDIVSVSRGRDNGYEDVFDTMSRQVTHMARLLDDLLDVSRISRNKITLHKIQVDLTGVLLGALDALRPTFGEFGHVVTVNVPEGPVVVEGDQARLEQIVVNLLNNAAKYTDPGGRIHLSLAQHDDSAVVEVTDSGIGISAEMLPRVFELFQQADRSLDRARGGLGIGLTLVQNLVHLHGGSVEVASAGEGQGSTFTVHLPLARPNDRRDLIQESPPDTSARYRVLVVEDNSELATMTSRLLQTCGQEVVAVVADGPSAIDAACTHLPEFVFLDIGIPKLDGYEVARLLRANDQFKTLKLVALTGYGQDEDRRRSVQAGFDHHLTKPISRQTLLRLFAGQEKQLAETVF